MVEVYWAQDEAGSLCISGHSAEVPVPPHIQVPPAPSGRRRFGRDDPVQGFVIDPRQVQTFNA